MMGSNPETMDENEFVNHLHPSFSFGRTPFISRDVIESGCGMLAYLGLKERKPYPDHVVFDQVDPMGASVADKVVADSKQAGRLICIYRTLHAISRLW